jgi:hypothetical protein
MPWSAKAQELIRQQYAAVGAAAGAALAEAGRALRAAEARGADVVTDDDLDVDKLKGEEAAPVEGGDGSAKRFEREADDTTTRTPGGAA